jgi:hypothetical protein
MRLVDKDHSLQIDLAGAVSANELMYTASYVDVQRSSQRRKPGAADGVSTGATAKDMVAAPQSDVDREIEALTIHNADTASATVSVILKHGADLRTVMKVVLATLENLTYTKGEGWTVLTANGTPKGAVTLALARGFIWVGNSAGDQAQVDGGAAGGLFRSDGNDVVRVSTIGETNIANSDGTSGLYIKKTILALYDFATDGGAQGAITLTDAVTVPDNAVVKLVGYEVLTTCTSGTDAATIKLNLVTDGDLSTALAISDAKNPWDAGLFQAAGGAELGAFNTAPTPKKTTAARLVQITVAGGEDLTAGKIVFEMEYYVSS